MTVDKNQHIGLAGSLRQTHAWARLIAALAAAATLAACGGGGAAAPAETPAPAPTIPTPPSIPASSPAPEPVLEPAPVAVPVVLPSPTPEAAPTLPPSQQLPLGVDVSQPGLAVKVVAATSSAVEGGHSAALAIDGNTGTRWSSAASDTAWIQFDFGAKTLLGFMKLVWENAYPCTLR
eukprot:Opistho-1_new@50402